MKLRIKGNSVRLRLTKKEVEALAQQDSIAEQTLFGDTALTYRLTKTAGDQVTASFSQQELSITIPAAFANNWVSNNITGIDNKEPGGTFPPLYILVEKDFKCIDNTVEDQADNYDHPKVC